MKHEHDDSGNGPDSLFLDIIELVSVSVLMNGPIAYSLAYAFRAAVDHHILSEPVALFAGTGCCTLFYAFVASFETPRKE